VPAGRPFHGSVGPGETARIFTGGVLPEGADTVVVQERTQPRGTLVRIEAPTAKGKNVRPKALDFASGAVVLQRGRRLSDRDLALAAGLNHPVVAVHRRPKMAVLATGDELVAPGATPGPGQIVHSNGFAIAALARREGAEVVDFGIVPDRVDRIVETMGKARAWEADVLVTTGGASVGDYDLVQKALTAEGMELSFWKVALRPGRPMMHGHIGSTRALGLPGNPASSYVCAFLFLVPLIRKLTGCTNLVCAPESAWLGGDLPENDERADYLRAKLERRADGTFTATPFPVQDSALMVPLAEADCLVVRKPYAPMAKAGSRCSILRLEA
jgi:molybdopterin molybdotransferase